MPDLLRRLLDKLRELRTYREYRCPRRHYLILESGGIAGSSYRLVLDGATTLMGTDIQGRPTDILTDEVAVEAARAVIAQRRGAGAAAAARFHVTWDGMTL